MLPQRSLESAWRPSVHRLVTVSAVKQTKWLLCVHTPDIKFQVNTVDTESLNSLNATMSLHSAVLCQYISWLRGNLFDSAIPLHNVHTLEQCSQSNPNTFSTSSVLMHPSLYTIHNFQSSTLFPVCHCKSSRSLSKLPSKLVLFIPLKYCSSTHCLV